MRLLVLIPAHNEAASLPSVVDEVRAQLNGADILVVDDASTDDTPATVSRLGVRWLTMSQRVGTGASVRTGIRYAVEREYDAVVRIDGDGQHPADQIATLLAPIARDEVDVVIGSRYVGAEQAKPAGLRRLSHRALAGIITIITAQLVTDATSGFWAFGRRAMRVLVEHHPSGYPEPELRLFLSRNEMRVRELPVVMRPRLAGSTTLTPLRTTAAIARMLLLLLVVPLRTVVRSKHD